LESSLVLGEGEWRVILRWNADPMDLDLHCKMSKEPFDVYFGKKYTGGRRDEAMGKIELDVDVTNGNGPETITFTPLRGRNYRFFERNYTGARSPYSHVKEFSAREDVVKTVVDAVEDYLFRFILLFFSFPFSPSSTFPTTLRLLENDDFNLFHEILLIIIINKK
jgi:hypothetical protein